MNADGTGVVRLTTSFTVEMSPVWSPDGRQIAFTGNITDGTGFGIHVMDADGSSITRLRGSATVSERIDYHDRTYTGTNQITRAERLTSPRQAGVAETH